ncbi:MAG: 50S ribosomal protein L19 [Candidatus Brennerbacteria bacterium]|nr:50S ribosomal protein L19 [Candidatus Brennerbacteria bacterium]
MIEVKILEKIKPGAKLRVFEKIKEGDKERVGSFEGLVISRKHGSESGATFTVRRVLAGVGVEKIYPINSPRITQVKIISAPKKVHRAKLYYVRNLSSKKLREKVG